MTGEEKVHGSFSQGSQPLTGSFQRLRVQVWKILRSTRDRGETWHYWIGCNARNEGLNLTGWWTTQRKWCTFSSPQHLPYPPIPVLRSKFKTIPIFSIHKYLSCTPLPLFEFATWYLNVCILLLSHVLRVLALLLLFIPIQIPCAWHVWTPV